MDGIKYQKSKGKEIEIQTLKEKSFNKQDKQTP